MSFHGIPKRYVEQKGDPYRDHCEATAEKLAQKLELTQSQWEMALSIKSRQRRMA